MEEEINTLRAQKAELVAALEALLALHDPDGKFEPHGNKPALAQARAIIARAESATPSKHPDTEREWQTGTPDVPAGAMRSLWCAVLADNGKVCHSMLCYANGHAMPLADWVDTIPDCCKPVDGDEDNVAWYGWYEESCDHCETQWHSSANVIAWMELPKYAARKQGGSHD